MGELNVDQYGVIGIVTLLIGKMAVEYWSHLKEEKPGEVRVKVYDSLGTIKETVEKFSLLVPLIKITARQTEELHDWHSKTDASGNKLWYRGQIDETLSRIESRQKTISEKVANLERLISELKHD